MQQRFHSQVGCSTVRIGFRSGINYNFRSPEQETQRRTLNVQHRTFKEPAEEVGFEPTVGFPTLDFESSALNRTQPPFLVDK
jgi:hypothetical protein